MNMGLNIKGIKKILEPMMEQLENEYNDLAYDNSDLTLNEYLLQIYTSYLFNQYKTYKEVILHLPKEWHYIAQGIFKRDMKLKGKPNICWVPARKALIDAILHNRAEDEEYLDYLSYAPIQYFRYVHK